MKVFINDKNKLDSANFQRLIIALEKNNALIKVQGREYNYPTIPRDESFYSTIKNIKQTEKIVEIIDYYLRTHNINMIDGYKLSERENDRFFVAYSCNRSYYQESEYIALSKKFPEKLAGRRLERMIYSKYHLDRLKFLEENNEVNRISIRNLGPVTSSYRKNESGRILLSFSEDEKNILKKFINLKLDECEQEAIIFDDYKHFEGKADYSNRHSVYVGKKLICGDLEIKFDDKYNKIISDIVKNHNNEIQSVKKLQLKMEGF